MPRGTGELLFQEKVTDERGNLYEAWIWKVPVSSKYRDGIRYRLAFILHGQSVPAVLYDNHHPKGHHRHLGQMEEPYGFQGVERLIRDFLNDVRQVEGGNQ